ncbi:hypothetical protein HDU93_001351 [Gonapodya sp. JEL0774]|nr:hypothetical protein HDU93_001351 [Gonapodya sp. JEL0774]
MSYYTREEVSRHATPEDCWVVIDGHVYDVTRFARFHPGGETVFHQIAGSDATSAFEIYHHHVTGAFRIPRRNPDERIVVHKGELVSVEEKARRDAEREAKGKREARRESEAKL